MAHSFMKRVWVLGQLWGAYPEGPQKAIAMNEIQLPVGM
jgi:hypothetical protein